MVRMGVIWDRTVAFAGERTGALMAIALATMVVPGAVSGALEPLRAAATPGTRLLLAAVVLVAAILSVLGQLAVTALALGMADRSGSALRQGAARLPVTLGLALLLLVGLGLLGAPLSAIVFASGGASMDMNGMRVMMTGDWRQRLAIATIVTTLVMLWLGTRLSVLMPVIVAERRGLRAIPRAFGLTRGAALRLAGVILLYGLVVTIVTYAAQTVFGTVALLVAGNEGTVTVAGAITALVVSAVGAVFTVLASIFLALLYRALRAAREGAPAA